MGSFTFRLFTLVGLGWLCVGCNLNTALPPTVTNTPSPTLTFTPTLTATITVTPSPTLTPTLTLSPTVTETPTIAATPTITPTVTATPQPVAPFLFNSRSIQIPDSISGGIAQPLVAFINFNDRERASSTLEPANNTVVLYYGSPTSGSARVPVLQLESLTTEDVYIAPEGNAIAYLLQDPRD